MSKRKLPLCILVVAVLVGFSGCGSDNAYKTVRVSGTIKYDDGSVIPASRIELKFIPLAAALDKKTKPKLGIAEVEVADGSFSDVSTYDFGDGIVAGEHKVIAMAMDEQNAYIDAIPEEFRDFKTTPLTVDTSNKSLELIIPKP